MSQATETPAANFDRVYKIKVPLIPPRVVTDVPRLPDALLERYRQIYVPDLSDAVGPLYTMDSGLRPFFSPIRRLVGRALTVKAIPGDNLTIHGAMGMVQPGDVMIIDWRGYTEACGSGTGSLTGPISRGLLGLIIDGGWRDIDEIQALDFPIFSRSVSSYSPPKRRPGEINVPVHCGGVVVHPGDLISADKEGICVVPREHAERVASKLEDYKPKASLNEWLGERADADQGKRDAYAWLVKERGGSFEKHGT